jgi:ferredoxin/formate-dependent nitrite reductase membrane component NrfD
LAKRPDGIVDIDPAACIGCKACMQGCPYDALYINDSTGTAEKCHFCAHRTEIGLAPACAVVCPTEAIIPGDFDDSNSTVSRLRRELPLTARKAEAGTGPNVLYHEVGAAGIDPSLPDPSGGYLWATRMPGVHHDAERFDAGMREAEQRARTTYNVDHPALWGFKVSAYLFTKSLAAGLFLAMALLLWTSGTGSAPRPGAPRALSMAALAFLLVTTVLLVADLKRPERFLYILLRPNWSSWLTRGSVVLMGFGAILSHWLLGAPGGSIVQRASLALGALLAALTASYTGWLFGQAKGRVLWMRRGLWLHLAVQAAVAGLAFVFVLDPWIDLLGGAFERAGLFLLVGLALHAVFVFTEGLAAPRQREREYHRAARLITRGPFATAHWSLGVVAGIALPVLLLLLADSPAVWATAGALTLVGLYVEEDLLVRAGQALPIS